MLGEVTPVVLCYNEAPNIERCLQRLTWAKRVIVVDSGSTDTTAELVARVANASLLVRPFDNHTAQWNYGVQHVSTEWVLSLDADYIVPDAFIGELCELNPSRDVAAFYAGFRYCIGGRPLRASLYPPRALLFRKSRCTYVPDGHTQKLRISGATMTLTTRIDHDDRKPLGRWLASQIRYAELEAEHLLSVPASSMCRIDRLRSKAWITPFLVPVYCLGKKGLWLDGLPGWHYTMQRWLAECMTALAIIDRRLVIRRKASGESI